MKIVNQTVGRAIRHKNDYAAIILVDRRYKGDKVIDSMPDWLTRNKQVVSSADTLKERLKDFFANMRIKYPSESLYTT
jgi:chromosome transmission fidelity protein 1